MAYFAAILRPNSARSCVMQSTLPTKGMRSIISMVSISLEDFLPSILLLMVIIVVAVIVTVIRVIVVIAIVGVVIVVAIIGVFVVVMIIGIVVVVRIIGGVPSIIKLLFVIIGGSLGPVFLLGLSAFVMAVACASRVESNIGGGTIAGRAIITWDGGMASYVCTYGSSCKGGKNSMSKRYLVKSSEELGEMFPGKITVAILVRDRCPRGRGNFPMLPIKTNIVRLATPSIGNMELENSQNNSLAKLPILKLGEYEMWEIRIKQYFQIQDYALWEVIEYGNSWVPIPITAALDPHKNRFVDRIMLE
ncbi:hypothetical protein Tco_0471210 [Tanacetum coccineum]